MRLFFLLCLSVMSSSCVSLKAKKAQSKWQAVESAPSLECHTWPKRERDLEIKEVMPLRDRTSGFLVTGLSRQAAHMHYFVGFRSDTEVDVNKAVTLEIGRDGVLLGGYDDGNGPIAVVSRAKGSSEYVIERRTISNNVVVASQSFQGPPPRDGLITAGLRGIWIALRGEDDQVRIHGLAKRAKDLVRLDLVILAEIPVIVSAGNTDLALIRSDQSTSVLTAYTLRFDNVPSAAVSLPLPIQDQLESWHAAGSGNQLTIGFVDGDSLVGRAEVKSMFTTVQDGVITTGQVSGQKLGDQHISEPIVASHRGVTDMFFSAWFDGESTIARYRNGGHQLGKPSYSGVFSKETRLSDVFSDTSSHDQFALLRRRLASGYNFELCELN